MTLNLVSLRRMILGSMSGKAHSSSFRITNPWQTSRRCVFCTLATDKHRLGLTHTTTSLCRMVLVGMGFITLAQVYTSPDDANPVNGSIYAVSYAYSSSTCRRILRVFPVTILYLLSINLRCQMTIKCLLAFPLVASVIL
jgi:hypothetical protein